MVQHVMTYNLLKHTFAMCDILGSFFRVDAARTFDPRQDFPALESVFPLLLRWMPKLCRETDADGTLISSLWLQLEESEEIN